jgi:hypothetical protein
MVGEGELLAVSSSIQTSPTPIKCNRSIQSNQGMKLSQLSTVRVIGWLGFSLPLVAQLIYSEFFCHYSFLATLALMFLLSIPAMIWLMKRHYLASIAASGSIFFWVVWENHIQCISEAGPFVGGLGPIYLLTLGLSTAWALGILVGWLDRRYLKIGQAK